MNTRIFFGPDSNPTDRPTVWMRRCGYALFVLLVANLGAITDKVLHPEIPYLDPEHLVVGGVNAAAVMVLLLLVELHLLRRGEMEAAIRESGEQFHSLFENMLAGVAIASGNEVLVANKAMLEIFGYTVEEFRRVPLLESIAPDSRALFQERALSIERGDAVARNCEYHIRRKDGAIRTVHAMCSAVRWQGRRCRQVVFIDITEIKRTKADLIDATAQLETAGRRIKVLSGLLPICCGCKKIKDDNKYWHQVEHYISEHSEATFTHGLCPDCAQKIYPELDHVWR